MPTPTQPATPPDPDAVALTRLQQQIARLDARLGVTGLLAPGVDDGPTGTITLGEQAGALGPWLAHDVLATAAEQIATHAGAAVGAGRVLVTDDAGLLRSDVLSHQVHAVLHHHVASLDVAATLESATAAAQVTGPGGAGAGIQMAGPPPAEDEGEDEDEGEGEDEAAAEGEAGGEAAPAAATPLAVALDLVRLTAVDHTLAAVEVTGSTAVLARLTAGELAAGPASVVLDGFGPVDPAGPTTAALAEVQTRLRAARDGVDQLVGATGALTAEVAGLTVAVTTAQADWAAAVADAEAPPGAVPTLRAELDRLLVRLAARRAALAPARAVVEQVTARISAAQDDLAALLTVDASGTSPLLRACSRERLHVDPGQGDDRRLTHVLHTGLSHLGADALTRRSVLGSSGRIGFLGAASTDWTLLDATTGLVAGGGAQQCAGSLTYDLESGLSARATVEPSTEPLAADPWREAEERIRTAALVAAGAIAVLAVVGALSLVIGWFTG